MKHVYLVAKTQEDTALIRKMLPLRLHRAVQFVVAEDASSAVSAARTLLTLGRQPVGLVVDSGTQEDASIRSQKEVISALLGNAASHVPYRVFVASPSLREVWSRRTAVNTIPLGREIRLFVKESTEACLQGGVPTATV
jgi:hypothetical protein